MGLFVNFQNTSLHYTDIGKGGTVVLLHGFLENSSMWDQVVPVLSQKNRVLCIDLLGHGKTENRSYVHSMEQMAEAVAAVLRHLRIRKAVMVGHSMGGYVALAFAEKNPKRIKGLCLMNATAKADSEVKKRQRTKAIQLVKDNHQSFIRKAIPLLFQPKNRKRYRFEVNRVKQEALKTSKQGVIAALEGMKLRKNRAVLLRDASYPVGMLVGKKDPVLNCEDLLAQLRGTSASVHVFSAGHMSHIENKTACIDALQGFLKKCRRF
jgi:pimeloyl-ACP methyl ester carboxylesterase